MGGVTCYLEQRGEGRGKESEVYKVRKKLRKTK
jgi:hypothetical protein